MELNTITDGGVQIVPQIVVQYVYLDFDGELTSYNGEVLTVDEVAVQDSKLSTERISEIVSELNAQYAEYNVVFVTRRPTIAGYSTIYIGKTSAFDEYGNFTGLAETIDKGNLNKTDKAFVMLDAASGNESIISTISHETNHLLGILDHGGNGIDAYACHYLFNQTFTGIIEEGEDLWVGDFGCDCDFTGIYNYVALENVTFNGFWLNVQDGDATDITINGGTAEFWFSNVTDITFNGGAAEFGSSNVTNITINGGTPEFRYSNVNGGSVNSGVQLLVSSGTISNVVYSNGLLDNRNGNVEICDNAVFSGVDEDCAIVNSGFVSIGNAPVFHGNAITNWGKAIIGSSAVFFGDGGSGLYAVHNFGDFVIGDNAFFENHQIGAVVTCGNTSIGKNAVFSGNTVTVGVFSDVVGGAVNNRFHVWGAIPFPGSLTIADSAVFVKNTASCGGAIYNECRMSIGNNAMFSGNRGTLFGGAIYNDLSEYCKDGLLSIGNNAVFSGNIASDSGGAVVNFGIMTIGNNAVFAGNVASNRGGAVDNIGTMTIGNNAVFSGNIVKRAISAESFEDAVGAVFNWGTITFGNVVFATHTDTVYNGGRIVINGNVSFAGNVTRYGTDDGLHLNNGNIDLNISVRMEEDGILLEDWQFIYGNPTYSITVSEKQASGVYQLAGNAGKFNKHFSVRDQKGSELGKLSLDMKKPLNVNGMSLMLVLDKSTNILSVVVDSEYSDSTDRENQETQITLQDTAFADMTYGNFTIIQAPAWLSIDPDTGVFSGITDKITGTSTGYGSTEVVISAQKGSETREHTIDVVVVPENIKGDGAIDGSGSTMTDVVAAVIEKRNEHSAGDGESQMEISINEVQWNYCGLDASISKMSASLGISGNDYSIKLQGKLGLSIFDSGKSSKEQASLTVDLTGEKYIKITTPLDFGSVRFDIVGDLTFKNLSLSDGFLLKEGIISVNTEDDRWSGSAEVQFTYFDKTLKAEYIVVKKQVDTLTMELTGLDIAVGSTGLFLESIRGGVKNLSAGDKKPSELVAGAGFYYGSQVSVFGSVYSLATLNLDVSITNRSITGSGKVDILGKALSGTVAVTVDWKDASLTASGNFTLANLTTAKGAVRIDKKGNIAYAASGIVDYSKFGLDISLSSNIMLNFSNDKNYTNDYYAAWASGEIFGVEQHLGVKFNMDGSWQLLGTSAVEALKQSGPIKDFAAKNTQAVSRSWDLTGISGTVLLTASWESGETAVHLTDGNGNSYTLEEIRKHSGMEIVESLSGNRNMVIALKDPVSGVWTMSVSNGNNVVLNANTLDAGNALTAVPQITASVGNNRNVSINWNCSSIPEGAELCIYYDTDSSGHDGSLIAQIMPNSASGTVTWTIPDAIAGKLYFYAVLSAPDTLPVVGKYTSSITVNNKAQQAEVDPYNWNYLEDGFFTKDACISNGGLLEVDGGSISGTTSVKNDGEIVVAKGNLSDTLILGGSMTVKGPVDVSNLTIIFDLTEKTPENDFIINDFSQLSGTPVCFINVAADQQTGVYKLAAGAGNFNGTISIGDGNYVGGTLTVNGGDITYWSQKYSLDKIGGDLLLSIYPIDGTPPDLDTTPPPKPVAKADVTTATHGKVTVSATFSSDSKQKQFSYDGKNWKEYTKGIVFSANGSVYFRGIDAAGNISQVTRYHVRNISVAGTTSPTNLYQNNKLVSSGAVLSGKNLTSGWAMYVSSGGVAQSTVINRKGALHVYSGAVASNTTVNQDGYFGVGNGAVTYDTTLGYAGKLTVWNGGRVYRNTLNKYGALILSSGAIADSSVVNANGGLHVYSGAFASHTTVKQSGYLGVGLGATTYDTVIDYAGKLTVWGGGTAIRNTIEKYGNIILSSGAKADKSVINAQGALHVYSGAVASNTTVKQSGYFGVGRGAKAYNTVIDYAGKLTVWGGGAAYDNTIHTYGAIILSSGAVASKTLINAKGGLHIYKGAVASAVTVASGANLGVGGGGKLVGGTVNYGAGVTFYKDSILVDNLDIAGTVKVNAFMDVATVSINIDLSLRKITDSIVIDNISNFFGASFKIVVDCQQSVGRYNIAGGAANFNRKLILADNCSCNIITVGNTISANGRNYTLGRSGDTLFLDIANTASLAYSDTAALFVSSSSLLDTVKLC